MSGFTPSSGPDHQSHAALPGLTQLKSPSGGGLRLPIRCEAIMSPARSPIITTRQAVRRPPPETKAGPGRFGTDDSRTRSASPSRRSEAPA